MSPSPHATSAPTSAMPRYRRSTSHHAATPQWRATCTSPACPSTSCRHPPLAALNLNALSRDALSAQSTLPLQLAIEARANVDVYNIGTPYITVNLLCDLNVNIALQHVDNTTSRPRSIAIEINSDQYELALGRQQRGVGRTRGSMGGGEELRQQGGTGEERMGWLSAVAIGAITPGFNRPTLVLMNVILVGLLLSFAALLPAALRYSRPPGGDSSSAGSSGSENGSAVEGGSSEMLYHVVFLLLLTLLLIALLNWLAWEVGTVSAHSQARHLLAPAASCDGAADAHSASGAHDAEDASGSRAAHGKRHKKKRQGSKRNFKGQR
ncbi:unnamed protein product [Closterium sp. Yama58-4]|nr:unnamed protein product [Closterium sp. Yama58-4]